MDFDTGVDENVLNCRPRLGFCQRRRNQSSQHGVCKIVRDTGLTKNEKKRIESSIFGDLESNVYYSLKKQKRWESFDSVENVLLAAVAESSNISLDAVERYDSKFEERAHVFGKVEAGSDVVELVKTKSKRDVAIKSLENSIDCRKGNEADVFEKSVITVCITKPSPFIGTKSRGFQGKKRRIRKEVDHLKEFMNGDDYLTDLSDDEVDVVAERSDSKMNLIDFVVALPSAKRNKKRSKHLNKMSDNDSIDLSEDRQRPSTTHNKVTELQKLVSGSTLTEMVINSKDSGLTTQNFIKHITDLVESKPELKLHWINQDKTNCYIDLSKWFDSENMAAIVGFHLVHPSANKSVLKITVNTSFPCRLEASTMRYVKHFDLRRRIIYLFDQLAMKISEKFEEYRCSVKLRIELDSLMYDAAADSPFIKGWNDYELMQNAEKSREFGEASSSKASDPNWCEYCGCSQLENLVTLNCGHVFCCNCARSTFTDQIMSQSSHLQCPVCQKPQNIQEFLTVLPIPLIRAALKNCLDSEELSECPVCCRVFETVAGVVDYKCGKCKIAFCSKCKSSAHFPISCSSMRQFLESDQDFKTTPLRHDLETNRYYKCRCRCIIIRRKDDWNPIVCAECGYRYFTKSLVDSNYFAWDYWKRRYMLLRKIDKESIDSNDLIVAESESRVKYVDAKNEFFDFKLQRFVQMKAKGFLNYSEANEMLNTRQKALQILFFGQIWIHLERNSRDIGRSKAVVSSLNELKVVNDDFKRCLIDQQLQFLEMKRAKLDKAIKNTVVLM